jgi:hypothetical protein
MIIEVPNIKLGSSNLFKIIKEDCSNIREPVYYPITDFLISVFEKKSFDNKELNFINELKISKFIKENQDLKNFIIIYQESNNLNILIKNNNEYKFLQQYKLELQSLMTIYENYQDFQFNFLKDSLLEELIFKMQEIYSQTEINSKFKEIKIELNNNDFKELIYNDNIYLSLKNKFLNNKKKYSIFISFACVLLILILGYKYYLNKEKEKELERISNFSEKPLINLELINSNYNKYLILKDFLNIEFENLNIEKNNMSGIIYSEIEFENILKMNFGKGYYFELIIKNKLKRTEQDIKKESIDKLIKINLNNIFKDNDKYYINELVSKEKLLDFIYSMSYNNEYIYDIFIKKQENEKYEINLFLEKKGNNIK